MRIISIILLGLTSSFCFAQGKIKGQVLLHESSRGLTISNSHKPNQEFYYSIRITKTKKGKLAIDSLVVPIEVYKDNELISSVSTNKDGYFELENLKYGEYQIQVNINKYLRVDTVINHHAKRNKLNIVLDDRKLWKYVDSTQLAKYPYNAEQAKTDIQNGIVKILTAGLTVVPDNQLDSIASKYGFEYEPVAGCVLGSYQQKAMDNYNKIVFEHLDNTNPPDWRDRLKADIQIAFRSQFKKEER